jgi:lipoprotein-releasing system permease protein
LFDAISVEVGTMSVILFVITFVAAFAIMNTLITVTVMKRREIGVLKALGCACSGADYPPFRLSRRHRRRDRDSPSDSRMAHFLRWHFETSFAISFRACWESRSCRKDVYQLSSLPAEVVPGYIVLICIASFAVTLIAGFIASPFRGEARSGEGPAKRVGAADSRLWAYARAWGPCRVARAQSIVPSHKL